MMMAEQFESRRETQSYMRMLLQLLKSRSTDKHHSFSPSGLIKLMKQHKQNSMSNTPPFWYQTSSTYTQAAHCSIPHLLCLKQPHASRQQVRHPPTFLASSNSRLRLLRSAAPPVSAPYTGAYSFSRA